MERTEKKVTRFLVSEVGIISFRHRLAVSSSQPKMYRSAIVAAIAGSAAAFAPSAPLAGRATTRAVGKCFSFPLKSAGSLSASFGVQCSVADRLQRPSVGGCPTADTPTGLADAGVDRSAVFLARGYFVV